MLLQNPLSSKPKTSRKVDKLTLHTVKSIGKLQGLVKGSFRADLASAAHLRYAKTARYVSIKKGIYKKVVKSTPRGSKK